MSAFENRSNSSLGLRTHLKNNFVFVPEISQRVLFSVYCKHGKTLFFEAVSLAKSGEFRRAYVDFQKFILLVVEKLPKHSEYKSKSAHITEGRSWLTKATVCALKYLESIVVRLDEQEDLRLEQEAELALIDEFDCDNEVQEEAGAPSLAESNICAKIGAADLAALSGETPPSSPVVSPDPVSPTSKQEVIINRELSRLAILAPSTQTDSQTYAARDNADSTRTSIVYDLPDLQYPSSMDVDEDSEANTTIENISLDGDRILSIIPGLTPADMNILSCLGDYNQFYIAQPMSSSVQMVFGSKQYNFQQDDFHISYAGFLKHLPAELQMTTPAVETNRCFFIHLGISLQIHPFALQSAFRAIATDQAATTEEWAQDIMTSVTRYAGFVDANALCFLWPAEFNAFRICFLSGPMVRPIVSVFQPSRVDGSGIQDLKEVVIRCSGDHFTLLTPFGQRGKFKIIDLLIADAKAAKLVVQINEADSAGRSIKKVLSTR